MKSKILLIEDSRALCEVLRGFLGRHYKVLVCHTGEEGAEAARLWKPTLILLDILLPGIDGFEVLRRLQKDAQTSEIPVIIITGIDDARKEELGFRLGAVDYIRKPLNKGVTLARIKTHAALYHYRQRFKHMAMYDGLTGIYNRYYFDEQSLVCWTQAKKEGSLISILILDVDFFKNYNDHYGHLAGDEALCAVAGVLHDITAGSEAVAARYGGEEFIVLLPRTGKLEAERFAEEIRRRIADKKIAHCCSDAAAFLTVSIGGCTQRPEGEEKLHDFIQAADRKLYEAKEMGRNRVLWQ